MSRPASAPSYDPLRAYLSQLGRGKPFTEHDDLVRCGVVRSMSLLALVDFVADEYGVQATAADLSAGRFASLASIVAFIEATR